MYNSDTVYSTTTFRPVSPSPVVFEPVETPSPQRTRKLETPLHFDGGLFSDIKSKDGKLLSTVTVDRVHSSTRRDVTDSPNSYQNIASNGTRDYVDDIIKTETITNQDVIKVKFTPVPQELDSPRLLTPSQFQTNRTTTPINYIKDNYEDLQSYKIVNSLCKEKDLDAEVSSSIKSVDNLTVTKPHKRAVSPLANIEISEQLTKIDSYLQDSLNVCTISETMGHTTPVLRLTPVSIQTEGETERSETKSNYYKENQYFVEKCVSNISNSYHEVENKEGNQKEYTPQLDLVQDKRQVLTDSTDVGNITENISKSHSVNKKHQGVFSAVYNMPIHYHAAILCFILIVYNLIYQYIKQNCLNNNSK